MHECDIRQNVFYTILPKFTLANNSFYMVFVKVLASYQSFVNVSHQIFPLLGFAVAVDHECVFVCIYVYACGCGCVICVFVYVYMCLYDTVYWETF